MLKVLVNSFDKVFCRQAVLKITFYELVEKLGKPDYIEDGKTDAAWKIEFEDGIIIDIYNYKDGKNYEGNNGLVVEDIIDWHIGGFDKEAYYKIKKLFPHAKCMSNDEEIEELRKRYSIK